MINVLYLKRGELKEGDKVYVIDKNRPEHFNEQGRMDYLLDAKTAAVVSGVRYSDSGNLLRIIIDSGNWNLNPRECTVVRKDAGATKKRTGDL